MSLSTVLIKKKKKEKKVKFCGLSSAIDGTVALVLWKLEEFTWGIQDS